MKKTRGDNSMTSINLNLDGDNCWPDLPAKTVHHVPGEMSLAVLVGGMASGKPSVAIRLDLEDGTVAVGEVSLLNLQVSMRAVAARYGDLSLEGRASVVSAAIDETLAVSLLAVPGRWVAAVGSEIVCVGDSAVEVATQAERDGHKDPLIFKNPISGAWHR